VSNSSTPDVDKNDPLFQTVFTLPSGIYENTAGRRKTISVVLPEPVTARYLRINSDLVGIGEIRFGCGGMLASNLRPTSLVECRELATCRVHIDTQAEGSIQRLDGTIRGSILSVSGETVRITGLLDANGRGF